MAKKSPRCISLDDELIKKVEKEAQEDGRTFSAMLNEIVRRYFKKDEV